MGQNASRQRPADVDPHSVSTSTSSDRIQEPRQQSPPAVEQPNDTPRSSVRKSVLNFMRPSTLRSRVSSMASSSGEGRRSWRNSRRWSKAPEDPSTVVSSSPATSSASSSSSGLSTAPTSTIDRGKQPEPTSPIENGSPSFVAPCGPETTSPVTTSSLLRPLPDPEASPSSSSPSDVPTPLRPTRLSIDDETPESERTISDTPPATAPDAIPSRPSTPHPPTDHQPELSTSPPSQPNLQPQRQFPPPGTLVVVQGIVHTTDVSRTNPDPAPAPAPSAPSAPSPPLSSSESSVEVNSGRTRNRLSALLRPRSTSSRPSSTHIVDPPAVSTPPPELSPVESSDEAPPLRPVTPILNGQEEDTRPHDYPPPADQGHENRSTISSSSIDVLGTLLSVAAAATAASLLTGSSEPILSSGLTPGSSTNNTASPPATATASPTTPPPTYPSPLSTPLHDTSVAGRTERMRQAWGTIRERLGLRPSPQPEQRRVPDEAVASSPAPTDTRELMLAEMARAFNIGLGLNGLGGSQPTTSTGAGEGQDAPPNHTLPPEGSFDRFLVDLQIDLRTALTSPEEDEAESASDGDGASDESDPEDPERVPNFVPVESRPLPPLPVIEGNERDEGSTPRRTSVSDSDSQTEDEEENEDDDVSASDSEDDQDFHSAHASNGGNAALGETPNNGGRIDSQGRINWWRLYRFPPIQSPRTNLPQGSSSNVQVPTSPDVTQPMQPTTQPPASDHALSVPLPSTNVPDTQSSPNSERPSTPSRPANRDPSHPFPAPPPLTSVVPVIVVGLQSVTSDWRPEGDPHAQHQHAGATHDGMDPFGMTHQHEDNSLRVPASHVDDGDFDTFGTHQHHQDANHGSPYAPMPGSESGNTGASQGNRTRSRGWQHRAANAIRNLRPGRRTSSANDAQQPANPAGSRTFLIYVIGGYYPPDHSIVTGGPQNFDSFEALLELADLLGQVKPPTVSKDEIEKSGLEIIIPAQLQEYEQAGKIASNCVDRCLICLDDYEAEQELRVMTCRHAFHRSCVDEWLQKGRNNCPACRSTGVNVDASTSPSSS